MATIFGIKLSNRMDNSAGFQKILTDYGCIIKTRIGLHDTSCGVCSPFGIIILEVLPDEGKISELIEQLSEIKGVKFNVMEL